MHFINTPLVFSIRKTLFLSSLPKTSALRHSSSMASLKESLKAANNVVIISGEDISPGSGFPIYGQGGNWRKYQTNLLTTSVAFLTFPSIVWEFFHYRREIAAKAQPNGVHKAIAQFEEKFGKDKSITVITQSIDRLHSKAGTKKLIELHGTLFETKCIKCNEVLPNIDSPICEALLNRGSPDDKETYTNIPEKLLPHCKKTGCSGLLRPHIVWLGESLDPTVVKKAEEAISTCEVCLVVGSASRMFPAAIYASEAINGGAIAAEFNDSPSSNVDFHYFFDGPFSETVPKALEI